MKSEQSNWSKLSLGKEGRENKIQRCEGKGIIKDFVLPVKT
jgi:hypothetical protein